MKKDSNKVEKKVVISKEAQKQIDDQKAIDELQKALTDQIEKFNHKNKLIGNRAKFQRNKEKLQALVSAIGVDYDDSLDHEEINIQLFHGRYNSDKVLTISNTMIVSLEKLS